MFTRILSELEEELSYRSIASELCTGFCSHTVAQAGLNSHYITQSVIEHACLSLPSAETTGITHYAFLPHALFLESVCAHPPHPGHAHQCISTIPDVQMQAFSKSPRRSDSPSAHAHMRSPRPLPGRASLHAASLGTACARDLPARGLTLPTECVRVPEAPPSLGAGPRSPTPQPSDSASLANASS